MSKWMIKALGSSTVLDAETLLLACLDHHLNGRPIPNLLVRPPSLFPFNGSKERCACGVKATPVMCPRARRLKTRGC